MVVQHHGSPFRNAGIDAIDAAIRDAGGDAAIVLGRTSPWTAAWPDDRSSWPFVTFRVVRAKPGR